MLGEQVEAETDLVMQSVGRIDEVEAQLESGYFDFVIAELVDGQLPKELNEVRSRTSATRMIGIGHGNAVLYEGSAKAVDLGDKTLSDLLVRARRAAVATRKRGASSRR